MGWALWAEYCFFVCVLFIWCNDIFGALLIAIVPWFFFWPIGFLIGCIVEIIKAIRD